MQTSPPTLTGYPAWAYAIGLAIWALPSLLTWLVMRRKVSSDIHVSEAQADKNEAEGAASLINSISQLAGGLSKDYKAAQDDISKLRFRVGEQWETIMAQASALEKANKVGEERGVCIEQLELERGLLEKQLEQINCKLKAKGIMLD